MLSEEAKRELKAAARSAKLRGDFEQVRAASARRASEPPDLDSFIRFLTDTSRVFPPSPPRPLVPYSRVLL